MFYSRGKSHFSWTRVGQTGWKSWDRNTGNWGFPHVIRRRRRGKLGWLFTNGAFVGIIQPSIGSKGTWMSQGADGIDRCQWLEANESDLGFWMVFKSCYKINVCNSWKLSVFIRGDSLLCVNKIQQSWTFRHLKVATIAVPCCKFHAFKNLQLTHTWVEPVPRGNHSTRLPGSSTNMN